MKRILITGGAGFIGSAFARWLCAERTVERVTVVDNFSSGRGEHLPSPTEAPQLAVHSADIRSGCLKALIPTHDLVIHLAANSDIAKATNDPALDFDHGTLLTHHVLEAMRQTDCRRILFASSGGAYGDYGEQVCTEDTPLRPIAPYGAAKAAGEAMLSAYCHLFGFTALAFRFCNVTGPRQTHGIVHDFAQKLREDPTRLQILGDGRQRKAYIHVEDVVAGMLFANARHAGGFEVFNLTTTEEISVHEIVGLAVDAFEIREPRYDYAGGARGWPGDVPIVRLAGEKLARLGWRPQYESREALRLAFQAAVAG